MSCGLIVESTLRDSQVSSGWGECRVSPPLQTLKATMQPASPGVAGLVSLAGAVSSLATVALAS